MKEDGERLKRSRGAIHSQGRRLFNHIIHVLHILNKQRNVTRLGQKIIWFLSPALMIPLRVGEPQWYYSRESESFATMAQKFHTPYAGKQLINLIGLHLRLWKRWREQHPKCRGVIIISVLRWGTFWKVQRRSVIWLSHGCGWVKAASAEPSLSLYSWLRLERKINNFSFWQGTTDAMHTEQTQTAATTYISGNIRPKIIHLPEASNLLPVW